MQPRLPKLPAGIQTKEALKQIIDNDYAKPYPNAKLLGLSIDGEKRQIMEWK